MMDITADNIAFLGALVGGISMSIAIYLQLMVRRECNTKWTVAYLLGGVLLIMMNIQTVSSRTEVIIGVQMAAYLFILAIEIIGFVRILRRLELNDDCMAVEEVMEHL